MADDELLGPITEAQDRVRRDRAAAVPGTPRAEELQRAQDREDIGGFLGGLEEGFKNTAVYDAYRLSRDEGGALGAEITGGDADDFSLVGTAAALLGFRPGVADYDKKKEYDRLTAGIPYQWHDDIMQDNLGVAERTRARILEDMERGRRSLNGSSSQHLSMFAGSIADVDLPLMFMTGGGYKAAQVSRRALIASEAAGFTAKGAVRASNIAVGANAGLQAGLVVGAAQSQWRDSADWTLIPEVALQAMVMGAVLNPVVSGDSRLAYKAAQKEMHDRVASNNPNLYDDVDVGASIIQPLRPVEQAKGMTEDQPKPGIGAALAPGHNIRGAVRSPRTDPNGPMSARTVEIITEAENWRHTSGWRDRKISDESLMMTQVALHPVFNVSTSVFKRMYESDAATLNWFAGSVLESANGLGRGRYTAAAGEEMYTRRIFGPIGREYTPAALEWAQRTNNTMQNSGFGISQRGMAAFNRSLILEVNDRAFGRTPSTPRDPEILRAADAVEAAGEQGLRAGRGEPGQHPIDGFDQIQDRRGYMPYHWKGETILRMEHEGVATRDNIIEGLAQSYRAARGLDIENARFISRAVVSRAVSKTESIDTNLSSLLTADGREWLAEALRNNGMTNPAIDTLMARLTGSLEERTRDSRAKHRNEIDLNGRITTRDGSDVRVVDLIDNDVFSVWQQYARSVGGSSALARVGVTNRAQRTEIIEAIQSEQRALGETPIEADLLHSMFSHFNGGPIRGVGLSGKGLNNGIGPEGSVIKKLTSLALLGKMGLAQAAETGAIIAQNGLAVWWNRGVARQFDKALRAQDQRLLEDMAFTLGEIGQDHVNLAPYMNLDDMSRGDRAGWLNDANRMASQGQWIQGYTSAFNLVRTYQQRIATLGMMDRVFREIDAAVTSGTPISPERMRRYERDFGIFADDLRELENLVTSGVIEFAEHGGYRFVNRINMDQWDPEVALNFSSSITRNMNQVVQRGMAGEEDPWMHTIGGAMLTHLKTFPLGAVQKSFMRNAMIGDKQAAAAVMFGFATAATALAVRDAIDGKERTTSEWLRNSFGYSNMTGWVPMAVDPVLTMLGLEDYRINPYGPHSQPFDIPALEQANRMVRLPGAAVDTLTGNGDWHDRQALKALPFMSAFGLSRVMN